MGAQEFGAVITSKFQSTSFTNKGRNAFIESDTGQAISFNPLPLQTKEEICICRFLIFVIRFQSTSFTNKGRNALPWALSSIQSRVSIHFLHKQRKKF
ncbi:hypothetical protein FF021_20395 [Leptospira noguchii]|nr:hypothetical protein FF021_20395 [Leptospira noguchii]